MKILVLFVEILSTSSVVLCLKCNVCTDEIIYFPDTGQYRTVCKNEMDLGGKVECPHDRTCCMQQWIYDRSGGGFSAVMRDCCFKTIALEDSCVDAMVRNYTVIKCYCTSDYCNGRQWSISTGTMKTQSPDEPTTNKEISLQTKKTEGPVKPTASEGRSWQTKETQGPADSTTNEDYSLQTTAMQSPDHSTTNEGYLLKQKDSIVSILLVAAYLV